MIRQSIARSYAKGLFAVGEKDGSYRTYLEQMTEVLGIIQARPRIGKALMLPLFEMDKRKELLSDFIKAVGALPPVAALLSLLLERGRMNYLPMIYEAYGEMVDEKEGKVKGVGYSAFPVTDAVKTRIERPSASGSARRWSFS